MQICVRGRNDPHIGMQSPGRTNTLILACLEHPQQLCLQIERNICYLIHEERAFIRQLESSSPICLRIGEGAFDMTEQLALENSLG